MFTKNVYVNNEHSQKTFRMFINWLANKMWHIYREHYSSAKNELSTHKSVYA